MKKETTKKTFKMNGWIYTYNDPMTSNWGWPEGRKGERVRILKKDMLQLLKERDAFNTPYTEEPEREDGQEHGQEPDTARTGADKADSKATGLCISLPLAAVGVGNLTRLLEAKGSLIKKALGADDIRIRINEEQQTVEFPWWNELPDAVVERDEVIAYTTFISLLCKMSREAKRVTAKETSVDSEKYAFRCFLLRLGFIGNEYKGMRKVLLRRLSGSAAFVTKDKADAFSAAQKAKRDAAKEVAE